MRERTTPNRSRRHSSVRFVVMHDTGGAYPGDLEWLTAAASGRSADYYVRRDGAIWELNPDLVFMKTWHAGISAYQDCNNLNERAIGIEQEHATDSDDWPDAQVKAAATLAAWLVEVFDLDLSTDPIVSHARVALPPGRERDPRDYRWDVFRREVRQALGQESDAVRIVWGPSAQAINIPISLAGDNALANAAALSAATGLSVLAHRRNDGMVEIRAFFESHGFRVEWDASRREIRVLPKENGRR